MTVFNSSHDAGVKVIFLNCLNFLTSSLLISLNKNEDACCFRTEPNAQQSVRFNPFYPPKSAALRIFLSHRSSLANFFLSHHPSLDLLDHQSPILQSYSPTVPHLGYLINLVHLPAPLSNIGQTHSWLFGDRNPARSTYVHWYLPMKDLWNCDTFLWNTFVNIIA